ncbi:MAG: hypothetical protein JSR09_04370 [Bacteroidetes bacterium]|nr:hypothetical protein [Bacteroidota bacterium]MBS1648922.1 hypothetical protein [Bacteroidota bacterium]
MIRQSISYKDDKAFVFKQGNLFYRCLLNGYEKQYNCLMNSGLYAELVSKNLIINHTELSAEETKYFSGENIYKVIVPEQIGFVNYPYEWCFSQWKAACVALLSINLIAIKYGMIVQDATPYNFTFIGNQCILLDTSSFVFYDSNKPWEAYRQFCEEMLAPLLLTKYNGLEWPKLNRAAISGLPLKFASNLLPIKSYFNSLSFWHIHLHSFFKNEKTSSQNNLKKNHQNKPLALLQLLLLNIKSLQIKKNKSVWNDYYETNIESNEYLQHKQIVVEDWLKKIGPVSVADIGANTGNFSFIAAKYSGKVYAFDSDTNCIEDLFTKCKELQLQNITCAVEDMANPAPGMGWMNEEKIALLNRLKVNIVLALAVLHHLCITKYLPFEFVAKLFAHISEEYLIIEFVPKEDSKVKLLLTNREDIFIDYTEENFKKQFSIYFEFIEEISLNTSTRKLFLCRKK